MDANKKNMPEDWYRASRCCRLLGNPGAYLILRTIGKNKITPTALPQPC